MEEWPEDDAYEVDYAVKDGNQVNCAVQRVLFASRLEDPSKWHVFQSKLFHQPESVI